LNVLSPSVRDLIVRSIDSLESLELLMLLRRSPETYWSADAAGQRLGIKPEIARKKLISLRDSGLLAEGAETSAFRYAPDEQTRQTIDDLAAACTDQRIHVTNTIFSANLERLKAFTNAFKLKNDS
jgi:hypothetical protein